MDLTVYYNSPVFSDFKIISNDDKIIQAHKLILNQIPYFQTYFTSEITKNLGEIKIDHAFSVIEPIIKHLYGLKVEYQLQPLLDMYQLVDSWLYHTHRNKVLSCIKFGYKQIIEQNLLDIDLIYKIFEKENILNERILIPPPQSPFGSYIKNVDKSITTTNYLDELKNILIRNITIIPKTVVGFEIFSKMDDQFQYQVLFQLGLWEKLLEIKLPGIEILQKLLTNSHFNSWERSLILKTVGKKNQEWKVISYVPLKISKKYNIAQIIHSDKNILTIKCLKKFNVNNIVSSDISVIKVLLEEKEQEILYPELEYQVIFSGEHFFLNNSYLYNETIYTSDM